MNAAEWRRWVVLFLVAVAFTNAAFLWHGRDFITQGFGDFASFYTAGTLVRRGEASKLYDPEAQWGVQQEFAPTVTIRRHALPYSRPPFEAFLFLPLAYLPYPVACLVWMVIKIFILLSLPFLLRPYLPDPPLLPTPLLGPLCLSVSPVTLDLLQGQDAVLLLFIFTVVFVALVRKADFIAGILLSLGLFKFHLVLPVVTIFALRGKARLVGAFILGAVVLVVISGTLVGWAGILAYPRELWILSRNPHSGLFPPETMPNLQGFITSFLALLAINKYADFVRALVVLGGIAFAAYKWKAIDIDNRVLSAGFSLSIVIVILTSYYFSGYDMALLILPIFVMGGSLIRSSLWLSKSFFLCMGALLFIPAYWILVIPVRRPYWMPVVLSVLAATIAYAISSWRNSSSSLQQAVR